MSTNKPKYMGAYYRKNKSKFNNPKEKAKRAKRNKARRVMTKEKGKDVDHIRPLKRGGGNGRKNLRVLSRKTNRARK